MTGEQPYLLFDLGGTLVQLEGLVYAAALAIRAAIPELAPESERLAVEWARRTTERIHGAQGRRFMPVRELAAEALELVFRDAETPISNEEARAITGTAWTGFASAPKLSHGVTLEWLREIR